MPPGVGIPRFVVALNKNTDSDLVDFFINAKNKGMKPIEYIRDAVIERVYLESIGKNEELPEIDAVDFPAPKRYYIPLDVSKDIEIITFLDSFASREERVLWLKRIIKSNME